MAKGKGGGSYPNPKGHTGPEDAVPAGAPATRGRRAARGGANQGEPQGAIADRNQSPLRVAVGCRRR